MCPSRSVELSVEHTVGVFGLHLSGKVDNLILVTHVLENDQVLGIKRNDCIGSSLVEHLLGHECDADVPVMIALGKEIANFPRKGLVQQIVRVRHSVS